LWRGQSFDACDNIRCNDKYGDTEARSNSNSIYHEGTKRRPEGNRGRINSRDHRGSRQRPVQRVLLQCDVRRHRLYQRPLLPQLARSYPLDGWTILLEDTDGNVLQSTTTARDGSYSFTNLSLGIYRIREVLPEGWTQSSPNPGNINVAQGLTLTRINFSNTPAPRTPQLPQQPPRLGSSPASDGILASTITAPLV
jgi:hypothetical protein